MTDPSEQRWKKRILFGCLCLGALLGPPAAVWAQQQLKVWAQGDALSAKDLNDNFAKLQAAIPTIPPAALSGYEVVLAEQAQEAVAQGTQAPDRTWRVACPAGKKILGGGCDTSNGEWHFYSTAPEDNGWVCRAECMGNAKPNPDGTVATTFRAWAICAVIP